MSVSISMEKRFKKIFKRYGHNSVFNMEDRLVIKFDFSKVSPVEVFYDRGQVKTKINFLEFFIIYNSDVFDFVDYANKLNVYLMPTQRGPINVSLHYKNPGCFILSSPKSLKINFKTLLTNAISNQEMPESL